MPELPEVETIRRQLGQVLVGQIVKEVEVRGSKSFQGDSNELIGMRVLAVRRRGKGLVIDLDSKSLVIHLKMTGQLVYEPHGDGGTKHLSHRLVGGHPSEDYVQSLPSSHTRVVFQFVKDGTNRGVLYFNDQRRFGWIKMMMTDDVEKLDFVSRLGPEPWELTEAAFFRILQKTRKPVKVRLMDQDVIAGVGNIYANDALWEAAINPVRPSNTLTEVESDLLLSKVKLVLDDGIKYGGATAPDKKYMDLSGMGGKYQEHFRVYERTGEKCLRLDCNGIIVKLRIGGRGTYMCPECQK